MTEITATYRLDEAFVWESCASHRVPTDITGLHSEEDGPAGWMAREDGTWSAVDDQGIVGPPFRVVDGKAVPVDDEHRG